MSVSFHWSGDSARRAAAVGEVHVGDRCVGLSFVGGWDPERTHSVEPQDTWEGHNDHGARVKMPAARTWPCLMTNTPPARTQTWQIRPGCRSSPQGAFSPSFRRCAVAIRDARRAGVTSPQVEFEYERGGTLAYMGAYDVHRAHLIGTIAEKTGKGRRPRQRSVDDRAAGQVHHGAGDGTCMV